MLNLFTGWMLGQSSPKFLSFSLDFIKKLEVIDYIDFALVAIFFVTFWIFTKKSRIAHFLTLALVSGIVLTAISEWIGLTALAYILGYVVKCGVLGGVVLFVFRLSDQLMKGGNHSIVDWFKQVFFKKEIAATIETPIDAICQAANDLSRSKTGGLIVIERKHHLDSLIQSGVALDAAVSPYLIRNIFYEGAPLHDGALLIRHGRIDAAGCILPVTHRADVDQDLGTRHRAAIGLSENCDAVIVVISEESGSVSLAFEGVLTRGYDYIALKEELTRLLSDTSREDN